MDALGVRHAPVADAPRIVSLVPSITELLFDLGLGAQVVGRTQYCVHPRDKVEAVTTVGGTKRVHLERIRALAPTHVILNIDENPLALARQLESIVPTTIVTHPLAPQDNLTLFRLLGGIFCREQQAERLCERFASRLSELQETVCEVPRRQVLYLIWKKPWMTISRDTYVSRFLALGGLISAPERSTKRYPTIEDLQPLLTQVDKVLFSTEPFPFKAADLEHFAVSFQCPREQLALIDGEMTTWYGSRAVLGLDYLRHYVRALQAGGNRYQ